MTQIQIDANLPGKLAMAKEPVELCDATGRVLGHFVPQLQSGEYVMEPQITDDEMERRLQNVNKTFSTAEVLAYLEKL